MNSKNIKKNLMLLFLFSCSFNIAASETNNNISGGFGNYFITDSMDPVNVNTPFTFNVRIENNDAVNNLTNVLFSVSKSSDLSLISFTAAASIICTETTTDIDCINDGNFNLPPGSVLTDALVITTQSIGFTGVTFTELHQSGQTIAIEETQIIPAAAGGVDLTISKSSSTTSVEANNTFSYSLVVENATPSGVPGVGNATNIVVTDVLPAGVTLNSINSGAFNCSGSASINCTLATLNAGASETIVLNVTAPATTGNILNSASVTSTENDINTSNNNDSVNVNVTPVIVANVDLSIEKTAAVSSVASDGAFSYYLVARNNGSSTANNVVISDTLPAGVTLTSINPSTFSCSGTTTITCSIASLPTSGSALIVVNVTAPTASGTITNTASISSDEADANPSDNTNSVSVFVNEVAVTVDLVLSKTATVNQTMINNDFQYILSVTNNSSNDATNISLIDNLPAQVLFNSIDAGLFTCTGTSTISCQLANLGAGETQSVVIDVKAPNQIGLITNTANVTSAESDSDNSNNQAQAQVEITHDVADLEATTASSSQVVDSGDQFSFDATITNNGPTDAQNVEITYLLPTGFEQVTVSSDNATNCTVSATQVVCTLATLANQDTTTITVLGTAVVAEGILQGTVSVNSNTSDTNISNNSDSVNVIVDRIPMADLSLALSNSSNLNQGDSTDIQLNITNNGTDAAIQPEININLTGLLESVTVIDNSSWDCQVAGLSVSCQYNDAALPSGSQSSIQLNAVTTQVVSSAENLTINANISSVTLDPNLSNNTVNASIAVRGTPTEEELFTALQTALDGQGNQQVNRSIRNVASYCERSYFMALEGFCNDLYETALAGDGETINNVMEQITPNEVIGQSTSVAEMATAQFRNVGTRLAQLRSGGGGGFSSAGLNARYGSGSIPLGMLAYLNDTDTKDSTTSSDFVSPWGFFVNGTISMGDRDATGRELEFDFDTFGITAGVDYRLDAKKVLGIALGYANFDSNVDADTAELNSSGMTLTGYGSFYLTDNLYMDTRVSIAKPDFDQSRKIDFTLAGTHIQRVAKGTTNANQYSVAMSTGYHFNKASWNITPNASFQYIKTSIDEFTETGAGDFNFYYADQDIDSLTLSAGLKISKAISLSNGVITPQFDFDLIHETKNDGTNIEARFIDAPIDEVFIIETDTPDRNYGTAALGLVYISSNGKQAYINYRRTLGLQGFSSNAFNIGARFEF